MDSQRNVKKEKLYQRLKDFLVLRLKEEKRRLDKEIKERKHIQENWISLGVTANEYSNNVSLLIKDNYYLNEIDKAIENLEHKGSL
jgi:hypothetical protein